MRLRGGEKSEGKGRDVKDRRKIGTSRRWRRKIKRKEREKGTRLKGCRRDNEKEEDDEGEEKIRTQFAAEKVTDELNNMASQNVTMIKRRNMGLGRIVHTGQMINAHNI
jgi:hypothetical protein